MGENPLVKLHEFGQDIWLDYIRRHLIESGELQRMIDEDSLLGITSNPSIFDKAIAGSNDYDNTIKALTFEGKTTQEILAALTIEDVQWAADLFRPVFERLEGKDGYVSLEVNPHLAHDTDATIEEARRLWTSLNRPNVFIKVPATIEGLSAIRQLISEGINVNVTLLFGLQRYRKVAEAFISGLEDRAAQGKPLSGIASVASFFLSRIDVLVDPLLKKIIEEGGPKSEIARELLGNTAILSAKTAYTIYEEIFGSERFARLREKGAQVQRLLWASTSTKNPEYADIKYVEALIGPDTVNTVPLETLNAYRDHGNPAPRLKESIGGAKAKLNRLVELGLDLEKLTQELEDQGVEKFNKPYDSLLNTLEAKRSAALKQRIDRQKIFSGEFEAAVRDRMKALTGEHFCGRLWRKDASLWVKEPDRTGSIREGLGWLHVAEKMEANLRDLLRFAEEVWDAGFRHVVHMGMGGSSLAPMVFERTFSPSGRGIPVTVLDTTDPDTIRDIESRVSLEKTLFIVASKSGTTAEPLAFGEYFYNRLKDLVGNDAGMNFVVITDPGTPLVRQAAERGYRRTFLNFADIGGRYSALSYFGLVPMVLMGLDVEAILIRALTIGCACAHAVPVEHNPGVSLGAALGEFARRGRSKVTFLMPREIAALGMWLEQLIAESTGKNGTGLLPVAGEAPGDPSVYGKDRVFVRFRLSGNTEDPDTELSALKEAGHPVVEIMLEDKLDLAQEFLRWEIATATAGAVLEINPFDQPNVQESKSNTNRLLSEFEKNGRLPGEEPSLLEDDLALYAGIEAANLTEALSRFFGESREGDYLALLAYLSETPEVERELEEIRLLLRNSLHLASTLGYGPRYLHSTGQFHKGGPNTGLFILLTADPAQDVPIPGRRFSFGLLRQAQALGDLSALQQHDRRVIRIHLGADAVRGLARLKEIVASALAKK